MTKNAQITNGRRCITPCIKKMGMCTCKIEPYTKNGIGIIAQTVKKFL